MFEAKMEEIFSAMDLENLNVDDLCVDDNQGLPGHDVSNCRYGSTLCDMFRLLLL